MYIGHNNITCGSGLKQFLMLLADLGVHGFSCLVATVMYNLAAHYRLF